MAIYIEYEGIEGSVSTDGYQGHIEARSVDFNVTRKISMSPGSLIYNETSQPVISELTINKYLDCSCSALYDESAFGSTGKKVVVKYVHLGIDGEVEEYLYQTLEDCIISAYQFSAISDKHPEEIIKLSYTNMMIKYKGNDASDESGSPKKRRGHDLELVKT